MLGAINHIAIATPDLGQAVKLYRDTLGARVSSAQSLPEHGVTVVFVELGESKVELLEPLGRNSPIAAFLEKNPSGGMHHICYNVADIREAKEILLSHGLRVLGDGQPKIGAHGNPVLFLHPKDAGGVLVELEQVPNPE